MSAYKMKKVIYIVLLFIFLYNVPFTCTPISGSKIVILILIIRICLTKRIVFIKKQWLYPIICICVLLIYSIGNVVMQGTGDYNLVYAEFLFVFDHFLGGVLFCNLIKYELNIEEKDEVLDMLVTVAYMQAIIILVSFIVPGINGIIDCIAHLPERQRIVIDYGNARGFGLASSIVYDLAVIQSFALMMITYLQGNSTSVKKTIRYIIKYGIIFVSVLLTGRTGIIGVGFSIILLLYGRLKKKRITINQVITLAFLLCCFICGGIFFLTSANESIVAMRNYVLEGFGPNNSNTGFRTGTGEQIFVQYMGMFGDLEVDTWLFGDARFMSEDGLRYYKSNDLGIFRDINYFGIIGCAVLLLLYLIMVYEIVRYTKNKQYKLFVYLSLLLYLCAHFKGEFLLSCDMAINFFIMVYLSSVSIPASNKNEVESLK